LPQHARGGPPSLPPRRPSHQDVGYLHVARVRTANDPGDYKLAEKSAEWAAALKPMVLPSGAAEIAKHDKEK
jgi:hypothetical protein